MQQPAPLGQGPFPAVEDEARERDAIGAGCRSKRRAVGEFQPRGAANANGVCARRKLDVAAAIDTWCQRQRRAAAGGFVDGVLETAALVVGAAWMQAEMRGVEAE